MGTILHPDAILEAVDCLIAHGAQAIGGVESIITHLISKLFRLPTAHAPLPYYQDIKERDTSNPRASAEFISTPHFFCMLKGLARAPQLVPLLHLETVPPHLISLNNIAAIVTPASCLGGVPALAAEFSDIPLIAVRDNHTLLSLTNDRMQMRNVIEVNSYLEAAGVVLALREGIALDSLRRPLRLPECIPFRKHSGVRETPNA